MNEIKDFDVFKSDICHKVKISGDLEFISDTIKAKTIEQYFVRKQYAESLYLLAMVDYLCRINHIKQPEQYTELRKIKLKEPLYPKSILFLAYYSEDPDYLQSVFRASIPEFKRFNIVEGDVRNVV